MKLSLAAKILGAFSLIVFMALSISVLASNRFMQVRYNRFSQKRDIAMAQAMTPLIVDWMQQHTGPRDAPILPPPPSLDHGNRHSSRNSHHMNPRRNTFPFMADMEEDDFFDRKIFPFMPDRENDDFFDRILVTDTIGRVMFNTTRYRKNSLENQSNGIEIMNGDNLIGYLYLDWMVPGPKPREPPSYFRRIDMGTWLISFLVFLFAMGMGLLLTRHIVVPIKQLNRALGKVGKGNLDIRVKIKRRDEMGDLARGFNDMTSALESADTQRRRFIADSAHELRTPVSLIRTRIEMMEEGVYPMDRDGLNALAGETDRLIALIEELKTLASLESKDFSMITADLDLIQLVRNTVEANRPAIENSGISVETTVLEADEIWINGHADRLERLIRNLLTNALHYAHSRIELIIGLDKSGKAYIRVEDDGPGIPESERNRVFERFYRIDTSRSRASGGTGLGLAICHEIVRVHAGNISIESSRLGGAVFVVVLPTLDSDQPQTPRH